MANPIIVFVKKTYKVLIILFAAIVFFLGYNMYLVDRSLVNLHFALDKVDNIQSLEDAQKISKILDLSLFTEVASKELPSSTIARLELVKDILKKPEGLSAKEKEAKKTGAALYYSLMKEVAKEDLEETSIPMIEMAKDILSKPQDVLQLEDVKFALRQVIDEKERKRAPILLVLDKINQMFSGPTTSTPKAKLKRQVDFLKKKLKGLKDENAIQETYYELANTYTQLLEFAQARNAYRKIIDLNPKSRLAKKARFNLAWNEKIIGNMDEAIKEFEFISTTLPEEEIGTFSQYQIADTLRKKGDYEKAIEVYMRLAKIRPKGDLAQMATFMAGYTYLYDLKDYEAARNIIEKLKQEFKGTSLAAHIESVSIPSIVGQYRKEGFRLLREGYEFSLPQKYTEAHRYFDKALDIDHKDGHSYSGKSLAFLWLDNPDNALEFARRGVRLLPKDELASVNSGYIYIKLNLVDEAITEYKRFTAIMPFTSIGYYNLGYAYTLKDELEAAASCFHKAARINPKFALSFNNEGWCLWRLERYTEALNAFKKAIQLKPDYLDAMFNLGVVYKALGKYKESHKQFEDILKINPLHPDAQRQAAELEKILKARKEL